MNIAFIGGGNMARSLIGGMLETGTNPTSIWVSDPLSSTRQQLQNDFRINTTADNIAATNAADVIVLAVKPQQLKDVLQTLGTHLSDRLCISIAAGTRCADMSSWAGHPLNLVRCMPNTPALVQMGATALYAGAGVSEQQKQTAGKILAAVGIIAWVETEPQLDAVTAVSGSGPAYFFLLIEELINAGVECGMSEELASQLAIQTAKGAAIMAEQGTNSPATLRRNVTSPGGTTAAALNSFSDDQFGAIVQRAVNAAASRSKQLGDELGSI